MFYYFNAEMKYYEKPAPPTFANATDAELATMLAKHYNDEIDLSTMEGWEVGATRLIHLDTMQAPNPNSSNTWAAQDITLVIVAHDHNDLATPINGHTKAALTVQTRECMNNCQTAYNDAGHIYIIGVNSIMTDFVKWAWLYTRTYLNDKVWGAFPTDFKSSIKPSKHYRHTTFDGTVSELVTDTLFLPSYPEIFGTDSYSYYVATNPTEGTQFEYYQTPNNRIKYGNNNGASNGVVQRWWNSSASSVMPGSMGYGWGLVYSSDAGFAYASNSFALAPAFCM